MREIRQAFTLGDAVEKESPPVRFSRGAFSVKRRRRFASGRAGRHGPTGAL